MANLKHLTKLFQAVAARDWVTAEAVARDVARDEEKIGHHVAAQRLRGALNTNGSGAAKPADTSAERDSAGSGYFLAHALLPVRAEGRLADLSLRARSRAALLEITSEWVHRQELSEQGIERRSKLLFHGPPGCGKSVTARALGHELGLPVYVVRFDAVVGAYLGQTALHLRQVFAFAETTPSVLLVDEVDALGKRRGSPLDVGELDRVVIALLQELEHSRPSGLLVATSNLARQLDDALWRRFDLVVDFPRPTTRDLLSFARELARAKGVHVPGRADLALARSYAEAQRLVEAEERRQILRGTRAHAG